ncbi:MAG: hypothetical protein KAI22_09945 [Gammaproteobacteria bacterium]|nr:hypothetical protein [Gammaproteobacteria bacterium]
MLSGFLGIGDDQTPKEERKEILNMRQSTLNDLYKEVPGAKKLIQNSIGYAVFSNVGINLLVVSTANGSGVAHSKKSGKDTYMKMFSAGVGIGAGVKDFRGVFIFSTQKAFNDFVNKGWQASSQADAAAKSDKKGDAVAAAIDVGPGIKLFQLTEAGLALQATIQGTKYWKDEDLN